VHDIQVSKIAVGEVDLVNLLVHDESFKQFLGIYRNALGIYGPGKLWREYSLIYVWYLRGCEGNYLEARIVAVCGVEVVEIPAASAEDNNPAPLRSITPTVVCHRVSPPNGSMALDSTKGSPVLTDGCLVLVAGLSHFLVAGLSQFYVESGLSTYDSVQLSASAARGPGWAGNQWFVHPRCVRNSHHR
jgi:hypothetical protein